MLEILKFIFSSFWIWLGTVILILSVGVALNNILAGMHGKVVSLS